VAATSSRVPSRLTKVIVGHLPLFHAALRVMRATMSAAVLKSVGFTIVVPRDDPWRIANLADAKVITLRDFDLQVQEMPKRGVE
jgi:hypothetical protein